MANYTKIDGAGALENIAKPFDKDIKKIEAAIKIEKDKKKKTTLEKDLAKIKADKSKAQGEKLVELQTLNSKEAEQLFNIIQNALITAGQASGKAKKAYEEFNKAPHQTHVDTIQQAHQSLVGLPESLDIESKAFVAAQNDLRNDGVIKGMDSKDAAAFKSLRNKLIADNKPFIVKKDSVHSLYSQLSTMLRTVKDLLGKDTKKQSELRASATAQLAKVTKVLEDLHTGGPGKLKRLSERMLENRNATDQGILKTMQTQWKEFLAADKSIRMDMKTAKTGLDACEKLIANVKGDKELVSGLDAGKKRYDEQVVLLNSITNTIKELGTVMEQLKKKIK